jgi:amidase
MRGYEVRRSLGEWIERVQPTFGPGIRERFEQTRSITEEDVARATRERARITGYLDQLLAGDIVCLPTVPVLAPLRTSSDQERGVYRSRTLLLTITATIGGLPQISLPLADVDGIPVGLSFLTARGSDLRLLRVAEAIEQAR